MTGEHYPEPEPQEAFGRQSEEPCGEDGGMHQNGAEHGAAGGTVVSSVTPVYQTFERAFPTFYGAAVTRGYLDVLEKQEAEKRSDQRTSK